jgi:hypothetical protein
LPSAEVGQLAIQGSHNQKMQFWNGNSYGLRARLAQVASIVKSAFESLPSTFQEKIGKAQLKNL